MKLKSGIKIKKIEILNYDLYESPFTIDFSESLNIVRGTNGSGKSSLLYIMLYSIIGPYKTSVDVRRYKSEKRFSRPMFDDKFYRNRMSNNDSNAHVVITYELGNNQYEVTHSLFENKLLSVTINGVQIRGAVVKYKTYEDIYFKSGSKNKSNEIEQYLIFQYQKSLEDNLTIPGGFDSFITLMLDCSFFSEDREYTFWKANLTSLIVTKYLTDEKFYNNYAEILYDVKYTDSLSRHKSEEIKYATRMKKNIDDSEVEMTGEQHSLSDLILDKEKLSNKIDDLETELKNNNKDINSARKKYEEKSNELRILNNQWNKIFLPDNYQDKFKEYLETMIIGVCPLCGKNHDFTVDYESCAFCDQKLDNNNIDSDVLTKLDIKRSNMSIDIQRVDRLIVQLAADIKIQRSKLVEAKSQVDTINSKINNISEMNSDNQVLLHITKLENEKDRLNEKLEELKKAEVVLRSEIENKMKYEFKSFSQVFSKYANSFFGERRHPKVTLEKTNMAIIDESGLFEFELDGKKRRSSLSLSESQRIFTDLSFRFSILEKWHSNFIFISETPDSTLDLIHEENAASTFQSFIDAGNQLFITSNIKRNEVLVDKLTELNSNAIVIDIHKRRGTALYRNENERTTESVEGL